MNAKPQKKQDKNIRKKEKPRKFGKNTKLADIVQDKNNLEVLAKYGVPCVHCPMMKQEMTKLKIGDIAKMYCLDLEAILKELNSQG